MTGVGRPRTRNFDLPPRMKARRLKTCTLYYYCVRGRTPVPLGRDLDAARRKWAELESGQAPTLTFAALSDRYQREALAGKAVKTQRETGYQLASLKRAFNFAFEQIVPMHVRQYLDRRSHKIAANREISLLSHLWNWAREKGITNLPNPCLGVHKHAEHPRRRYVTDAEYKTVWERAPDWLRDAMDLALLTGQRPGDVLKMTRQDIQDGFLWVHQAKTGERLGIEVSGELDAVLRRISARPVTSMHLVHDAGQRVPMWQLSRTFTATRRAVGQDWQFRDIRAKTVTDETDLRTASQRAGHTTELTTAAVYRRVRGRKVKPLK